MLIDSDFHIHGKHSGGTSSNMNLENISRQALLKGLHLVGTGDALHPEWLKDIKAMNRFSDGIFELNGCKFIITTEVEDARRVHHCIILPGISAAEGLREALKKHSIDIDKDGRPHVRLNGEEIADRVDEVGGLIGPSHAFVPWTSIYKEYDSLKECYGKNTGKIRFLELGLSADTEMADHIKELQDVTFLSNSDAHSPWPHRLGREFNRLSVKDVTYEAVEDAILRKKGGKVELNVGFDPRLGKYHCTACVNCYTLYEIEDAVRFKWRCQKCKKTLKKGVRDRIKELASYDEPRHPPHRPGYMRTAPLAEILCSALGIKTISSVKIQNVWKKLVSRFGSEIAVLIDVPGEEIKAESNEEVARMIKAFRDGKFDITYGGGGKYGEIVFDREDKKPEQGFYSGRQANLDSFMG